VKNLLKILLLIIWVNLFVFYPSGAVRGKTCVEIPWQKLESKYTVIHYQSLNDLKKFDRKIDYAPGEWGFNRLFSRSGSDNLTDKLRKKVDAIYERVQEILEMRKRTKRIIIKIYNNKKRLHAAFREIYKTSIRAYKSRSRPRAWYTHEFKTIYLNVDDTHEGMLAHEMAHSIIDHYLRVRPPKATAEILARYVDSHLFD